MSFSFGSSTPAQSGIGFGSTAPKTAFTNFSFGGTPSTSTTTSTGFGGFGTGFSAPATSQPTFGGFGTPATSTSAPAPAFGSTFGPTTATAGGGFGATFGTPATSAPAFGATFGAPATSAPAFGASFGAPATTAAGGFGAGFGLSTSAAPAFGASFGAPASTAGAGFGGFGSFGTNTTATATTTGGLFSGFGAATTTTTASGFGGFGANTSLTSTGFGGFGAQPATSAAFPGYSAVFGAKPAGFGGFGAAAAAPALGQTLGQPQPAQQPADPNQAVYNSVFNCSVFGDERDAVLAKWNLLQASWGTGRGYYNPAQPPVDYTQQNPYCRFKAVGYSLIPGHDNREGVTAIILNKKEADVKAQKEQLAASLGAVMGGKPGLAVAVQSVRAVAEGRTQVLVSVQEKGMTGSVRRIPATDLAGFLLQPVQKQQLISMGVDNVFAHVAPDSEQLKEYLAKPPTGVDARIWKQAQLDNPDPAKYIPIPLVGFEQLKWRSRCQEKETALHRGFLEQVSRDILELKRRHAASVAKIAEQKRRLLELQHRVLQILVRQEVTRKVGMALQPEEEVLKGQLENMQAQLGIPTQFKGRLNELMAQIRLQDQNGQVLASVERYSLDAGVQDDIKQFLRMEQTGIKHLVDIIHTDLSHLKIIRDGMQEHLQKH